MIYRLIRIALILGRAKLRGRIDPLDACRTPVRVWLNEADLRNAHQASVAFILELARWDFSARCGLLRLILGKRYFPVMAAQTIQYLRPMRRLRSYEVQTRVVSWDERFFFVEHRVERGGKLHAIGMFRGVFKAAGATVPAGRIFEELGVTPGAPTLPAAVERWRELDAALAQVDP